jgi:glycerophosphoryl diester phosphodiesterase
VLVLAHRGAHGRCRENTVEAFRAVSATGADGVELDVRRSMDGVLVVHHDAALPEGRPVALTPSTLLPPWVPTLDLALDACAGLALVNVEVKSSPLEPGFDAEREIAVDVAAVVAGRLGILVSSFDLVALDAVRAADDRVATGWLTPPGYDQQAAAASAAAGGHRALIPADPAVDPALVTMAHDLGLQVLVWTVNDPARVSDLAAMGVDGVVTDRPHAAVAALDGRGAGP